MTSAAAACHAVKFQWAEGAGTRKEDHAILLLLSELPRSPSIGEGSSLSACRVRLKLNSLVACSGVTAGSRLLVAEGGGVGGGGETKKTSDRRKRMRGDRK
jgi:hypothetical protein